MGRKTVFVMVFLIVICTSSIFLIKPGSGFTLDDVKVGLYYYVWYEGVHGEGHWNGIPPDKPESLDWKIVDTPILGFYNSQDPTLIRHQLEWFKELHIDFLIISWWGPYSFPDNTTKTVFSIVEQEDYPIKLAIMVEAYNWSGLYNFETIYDYIYDTYVSPYESIYMKLSDLPLVCFFNDENMTGNEAQRIAINSSDTRFTPRIVGHNDYVDWWGWPVAGYSEAPEPILCEEDGYIGILPRYDDRHLGWGNPPYDANLTEGLYDKQWNKAITLANESKVNYVGIYSWNEYHERSQIEPHINPDGKYVLSPFCKTYHYIQIIPEFPSFLILPLFMIATLTAVIVYKRKYSK